MADDQQPVRWQVWRRPRGSHGAWEKVGHECAKKAEALGVLSDCEMVASDLQWQYQVLRAGDLPSDPGGGSYRNRMMGTGW